MSKLSPALKGLINASFARPGQTLAPSSIRSVYERIAQESSQNSYGRNPWLAISAAATFTLNSPDALHALFQVSTQTQRTHSPKDAAELIREVGLKCISFNGIPRTINCLGAFRSGLDPDVLSQLSTTPSRRVDATNVDATNARGRELWESIYVPFDAKLIDKLAESHPDLPVHILGSHYGPLLSDPSGERNGLASVGRGLTSIVAVACLRAQTGVGPQVLSHVFGLRKAIEQGAHKSEAVTEDVDGIEKLASDEGCEWILNSVDRIAKAIGGNFATRESKL
jgi:hypothetical protein